MRIIICFLLVLLSLTEIIAEPTYSGIDSGASATMTLGLSAVSGFTDSSSSQHGHVVFGFTADKIVSDTITPSDTLVLSESFDPTKEKDAIAQGTIYSFVRIASLSKLSFSIEWSDLQKTTDSSDTISYKINGNTSPYMFYAFDPSQNVMVDMREALSITTEEYANSSKEGNYESTITMRVTVGS